MNLENNENKAQLLNWLGLFFLANGLLFCFIGWPYLSAILGSRTLFINTVTSYLSVSGKTFVLAFIFSAYISQMLFLACLPLLVLLPFCWLYSKKKIIFILSFFFAFSSLFILIIDRQVYLLYHFHLNYFLLKTLLTTNPISYFELSKAEFQFVLCIALGLIILELVVAWSAWKIIKKVSLSSFFKKLILVNFIAYGLCYSILLLSVINGNVLFLQKIPHIPLYQKFFMACFPKKFKDEVSRASTFRFTQPLYSGSALNYPIQPVQCRQEKKYNLLLITIDSLRFDSLNTNEMPYLFNRAKNMIRFKNHYSGGNATQPGLFSLYYGLPPNYWQATIKNKIAPLLTQKLKENNYDLEAYYSAEVYLPPFPKNTLLDFDIIQQSKKKGMKAKDWDTLSTSRVLKRLKTKKMKPLFLQVFYSAPHAYCLDKFSNKFKPADIDCQRMISRERKNKARQLYYNRYRNAVSFIDEEIEKIFVYLDKSKLWEKTIVIVTSDHGQEFNDNQQNYWGHTSNFSDYQTKVPLLVSWPEKPRSSVNYQTSHYDIAPTIMTEMLNCSNNYDDYGVGGNLFEKRNESFLIVGSYNNLGLITEDLLVSLTTWGEIITQDKKAKTIDAKAPENSLRKALLLMRKFYKNKV